MIDIHTHVIPFVDDGSSSMKESLQMIQKDVAMGVDTIVCTPHHLISKYDKSIEEIQSHFDLLVEEVKKQKISVNLLLGQEIYYTKRENILEMLKQKKLLTLGGSPYVLLEFSFTHEPEDFYDIVYNFSCFHYKVIIAHAERYQWMNIEKIMYLKKEGALIQVNADSILKLTEKREYKFVQTMLKKNLIDMVASDMHSFRPSNLLEAKKKCKNDQLFEFSLNYKA